MTTADESQEFTEMELAVIFGMCAGLKLEEIAERCRITTDAVMNTMSSVFDKAGVSNRVELYLFVRAAINAELRRRSGAS